MLQLTGVTKFEHFGCGGFPTISEGGLQGQPIMLKQLRDRVWDTKNTRAHMNERSYKKANKQIDKQVRHTHKRVYCKQSTSKV